MAPDHRTPHFRRPPRVGALACALAVVLVLPPGPAHADRGLQAVGAEVGAEVGPAVRSAPGPVPGTALSTPPSTVAASGYVLPLPGHDSPNRPNRADLLARGVIVHDFADPGPRWGAGHRGVDLAATAGSAVLAPASGVVVFVGVVVDRPLAVITHPDGRRSTLEPVVSDLTVGSPVRTGEQIGSVAPEASTHCAPSFCLHWGVRAGERYLDPVLVLGGIEAVILLPTG